MGLELKYQSTQTEAGRPPRGAGTVRDPRGEGAWQGGMLSGETSPKERKRKATNERDEKQAPGKTRRQESSSRAHGREKRGGERDGERGGAGAGRAGAWAAGGRPH